MKFRKFEILSTKTDQSLHVEKVEMIFNLDHIISIKPIKIVLGDHIIDGYWMRTSNGKKYKATRIPEELFKIISEDSIAYGLHSLEGEGQDFDYLEESFH